MRNPVLMREIKTMFRSPKPFFIIMAYVGVLFFVVRQILKSVMFDRYNGFNPQTAIAIYVAIMVFQMLATFLIVPVLASTAISTEREKQTLDLMLMTRMTSRTIIRGKLMSSLLMFLIMIAASMPVYAVTFYYSASNIIGFAVFMLYCIVSAIGIGSISIFFSAFLKKTAAATSMSYISILTITISTAIIMAILSGVYIMGSRTGQAIPQLPWVIVLMACINPITSLLSMIDFQIGTGAAGVVLGQVTNGAFSINIIWILNMLINIAVSFVFIRLSAATIEPVFYKRSKKTKKPTYTTEPEQTDAEGESGENTEPM